MGIKNLNYKAVKSHDCRPQWANTDKHNEQSTAFRRYFVLA